MCVSVFVDACVCARAIIRSNLTYPRDDSMGTSDRLKERNYVFSVCVSLYVSPFVRLKANSQGAENEF